MDAEEQLTTPVPPDSPTGWNPSHYYSQPPADLSRKRSGVLGCGVTAVILLVLLFLAGGFFGSGGIRMLIGYAVGEVSARINEKTAPDLSQAEREAVRQDLESVVKMSRSTSVPLQKVVPVLEKVQKGLADEKLDRTEAQGIRDAVKELRKASAERGR